MSKLSPAVALANVVLPEFGSPSVEPVLPPELFQQRQSDAIRKMQDEDFSALIVYGDRERPGNVQFLTGYDPRFEEALLLLRPGIDPALIVGNEGWGYAELAGGKFRRILCQTFSLSGQPRERNRALASILADEGIRPGDRIGCVGWKGFGPSDPDTDEGTLEVPSFIADALRKVVGPAGKVINATDLFIGNADGLRVINDVHQLAIFEHNATLTSQALRNVLFGIRPGMTEREAVRLMQIEGSPMGAHLMLSSGPRAFYGLPSPSLRRVERGDPMTMAYCLWGALNARAGFLARGPEDLPEEIRNYVDRLVAPYFSAIAAWYGALRIGAEARTLYDAIHDRIGDVFFGVSLNPGHFIHTEEWLNSPVAKGSTTLLRSGMALQLDVIPATGTRWFTTNIEDGLALADKDLRDQFSTLYPEAWTRISRRRAFMECVLGLSIAEEVLPFSNIPAYLPPFWLSPMQAMTVID